MKWILVAGIGALAMPGSCAASRESCDQAFSTMRKYETENHNELQAALDVTFQGLANNNICTPKYLEAQDRVDAYYMQLAVFAKAFVTSCRDDPVRSNDVFLYDLPEIQSAVPSSVRSICEHLEKRKP